jgi:hypothetical protein
MSSNADTTAELLTSPLSVRIAGLYSTIFLLLKVVFTTHRLSDRARALGEALEISLMTVFAK